ncbi:gliding motility lipoprotein GldB [uncultured Hymenobacter sp.]|uniref:gliding motility protein GldB-related protein n=1 Tax=uncultured Hymenobacter sp. TaxID=170016 RepID=UPI0035CC43AF
MNFKLPTGYASRWSRLSPFVLVLVLLGLAGCGSDSTAGCRPDPADDAPAAPFRLQRLEQTFLQLKRPADAQQFLRRAPLFARAYLQRRSPANDTALTRALVQMATNPDLQKLGRETAAAFPDTAALRRDLGQIFRRVHHYFPDFKPPLATTYVSGLLGKDVFVNDSLLVVSLDYFAGPRSSYRPDLPGYMLRRYRPPFVLPTVALRISDKYNRHELTANTMLDAMIHSGKALYFAGQMLPCTPDSLLLGYSGKELKGVQFNEGKIWGHFLEKNLLYNTTPFLVQKYVGERPNVPEIDRTAPGRIGQWVGLQIIRKYMAEHPDVSLPRLMAERGSQRLLTESHYRPKR